MKKKYLTWNDIEKAIDKLANDLSKSNLEITGIGGLPRGGLIPAVMLSHKLDVPYIPSVTFVRHSGHLLIVDDICDSGRTLKQFQYEQDIYTAVLHYKESSKFKPDFFSIIVPEDEWIVYPWERKDSKTIQDYALSIL